MQYFQDVLTLTVTAASTFEAFDLVGFDNTRITGLGVPVKGVAKHPATEIGQDIGVIVIGTARVRARSVIVPGDGLISTADGVRAAAAGTPNIFATALTAAADGEFVTILLR